MCDEWRMTGRRIWDVTRHFLCIKYLSSHLTSKFSGSYLSTPQHFSESCLQLSNGVHIHSTSRISTFNYFRSHHAYRLTITFHPSPHITRYRYKTNYTKLQQMQSHSLTYHLSAYHIMLFIAYRISHIAYRISHIADSISHIAYCISLVTYHMLHLTLSYDIIISLHHVS